jgi:hypothetical protein
MEEQEASGGFKISQAGSNPASLATGIRDEFIYVWIGKRSRFKDRPNKKAWTMTLSGYSGSGVYGTLDKTLHLTDDSANVAATATPGGPRYNIVSGSIGSVSGSGATYQTFGWFYPEMGCMVFSGNELSSSIPGTINTNNITASFSSSAVGDFSSSGFGPNLDNRGNPQNALRLISCMRNVAGSNTLRLRSEEDQTQENYFCRIKANDYNFTANPTFVSGGLNKLRNTTMIGNPTTFITGVGLYNSAGQLLATAKLSSPLKKNFASEATVKVKLTY